MARIAAAVASAEEEPAERTNSKTGKVELIVKEVRSETGAIEAVVLWGPQQRAAPSAAEAIRHLKLRHLAAYYRVELFDNIGFTERADESSDVLVLDFWRRLKRLAQSVGIAVTHDTGSEHPAIGVALLSGGPRLVVRREAQFAGPDNLLSSEANFRTTDHEALLSLLTGHPLVKSVGLPAAIEPPSDLGFILSRSDSIPAYVSKSEVKAAIAKRGDAWKADAGFPTVCVVDGGISAVFDRWVVHHEYDVSTRDEDHGSNIASLLVAGRAEWAYCRFS